MPNNNVDERVVEMRIDNKKFEAGANASIKTLEKLEKALNIKSNSNAIDEMTRSVEKFDVSPITKGFDLASISLGDFIKTADGLTLVTNAMDDVYAAGKRMVKSLTTDQLKAGFDKYENMTESTQMIMGSTRDLIGAAMKKDWWTDELGVIRDANDNIQGYIDELGAYRSGIRDSWSVDAEGIIRDAEGQVQGLAGYVEDVKDAMNFRGTIIGFEDEASQMENVNAQLEKLLWFTDETSYSFTDMTSNVGKFLNAGVGLEEASNAMMGIAVWGASAGAQTSEVSRAMYNISQAMGTGKMTLMDWKSIENANMATQEVKRNILAMAAEKGVLADIVKGENYEDLNYTTILDPKEIAKLTDEDVDKIINSENFRESLKDGWLTTDVMSATFEKYGSFAEMLYGATEETGLEARPMLELLDEYRKAMEAGEDFDWEGWSKETWVDAERLEEIVKGLDELGIEFAENGFRMGQETKTWSEALEATKDAVSSGWMETFKIIFGNYLEAKEFWSNVTDELWEIFASGGETRNKILESWKELGGRDSLLKRLKDDEEGIQGILWNIVDAIHSIVNPIKETFDEVFGLGLNDVKSAGQRLFEFTERFRKFTEQLIISKDAQEGLRVIFRGVFSVLKAGMQVIGGVTGVAGNAFLVVKQIVDEILTIIGIVGNSKIGTSVAELIKNVKEAFLDKGLGGAFEALKSGMDVIIKGIPGLTEHFQKLSDIFDGTFTKVVDFIKRLIPANSKLSTIMAAVSTGAETAGGAVLNMIRSLDFKGINFEGIKNKFKDVFAVISTVMEGIFGDPAEFKARIKNFVTNAWNGFMEGLSNISVKDVINAAKLTALGSIVAQITGVISQFKQAEKEFTGIGESISGMFGNWGDAGKALAASFKTNTFLKVAIGIGILAASLIYLASVPEADLQKALMTLGTMTLLVAALAKAFSNTKFGGGNSGNKFSGNKIKARFQLFDNLTGALFGIAAVILAVSMAVEKVSKLDPKTVGSAALTIAVIIVLVGIIAYALLNSVKEIEDVDALKEYSSTLIDLGKTMLLIGGAVYIIVRSLRGLAKVGDPESMLLAAAIVTTLMGALAGLVFGFYKLFYALKTSAIDYMEFTSTLREVAVSMVIVAAAIALLVGPLIAIAVVGRLGAKVGAAFFIITGLAVVLGGIMGALMALMILLNKKGIDITAVGYTLMKIATSMLIISGAIVLLMVPLLLIAAVAPLLGGNLWLAVGVIGALVFILAALGALAGLMSGNMDAGNFIKFAAGIAILALAILLLTPALMGFVAVAYALGATSKDTEKFGKALGNLLKFAGVIAVMGLALVVFGAGLLIVGVAFIALGLGLLLMAAGMIAAGAAMPLFIEGLIKTGELMTKDNLKNLAKGAVVFAVLAIAAVGLVKAFKLFSSLNPEAFAKFGEGIKTIGEKLLAGIKALISNIGSTLVKDFPAILKLIGGLLLIALGWLTGMLPTLVDTVMEAIIVFFETLHQSFQANLGAIEHSIFGMIITLVELIYDAVIFASNILLPSILHIIIDAFDALIRSVAGDKIADAIRSKIGIDKWYESMEETANSEESQAAREARRQQFHETIEGYNTPAQAFVSVSDNVDAVHDIRKRSQAMVEQGTEDAGESLAQITPIATEAGEEGGEAYGASFIDEAGNVIQEKASEFVSGSNDAVTGEMTSEENSTENALSATWADILNGVTNNETFKNATGNIGSALINGVVSKIREGAPTLAQAISDATGGLIVAAEDTLEIQSPSHVMQRIGEFTMLGLTKGIDDNADSPADSVTVMASGMLADIQMAMMQVAALANEDMSISPVISPVVDMTNVDSAAGYMYGAFSGAYGMTMGMSDSINRRLSDVERLASNMNELGGGQTINGDQITVNVYPTPNQDPTEIADAVIERINSRSIRRGVAFGY